MTRSEGGTHAAVNRIRRMGYAPRADCRTNTTRAVKVRKSLQFS
nr:MAG TPA: hypothetical protein [Caudoviricetes sp.]